LRRKPEARKLGSESASAPLLPLATNPALFGLRFSGFSRLSAFGFQILAGQLWSFGSKGGSA